MKAWHGERAPSMARPPSRIEIVQPKVGEMTVAGESRYGKGGLLSMILSTTRISVTIMQRFDNVCQSPRCSMYAA